MAADGIARVSLPDGKIYHFNIIYHHARCPLSVTQDTELSLSFTKRVVRDLEDLGFVNSYYHDRDALPGRNVFNELFRVVEGSDYTIVILTQGFVQDCWKRYIQMAAFKRLLDDGQTHKFIPISVGLREDDIPQELNTASVLFFQRDWPSDTNAWHKLKRVFVENLPIPVADRDMDLYIVNAVEETNSPDGALADEYDGENTGRRTPDHSIRPSDTSGGSQGQDQDLEDVNRNVQRNRAQNSTDRNISEVSVGRSSLAHRDETDRDAVDRPVTSEVGIEGNGGREGTEQQEDEVNNAGDSPNTDHNDPQVGLSDNLNQELEPPGGRNTELHNNEGNYELDRRQLSSNISVDLRERFQRYQAGDASSGHGGGRPERSQQEDVRRDRRDINSESLIRLSGVNLRPDGGDIENSVINRLENRGMWSYRQDLSQTERKTVNGPDVSNENHEETQDFSTQIENIPSMSGEHSHAPSDLSPDGTQESVSDQTPMHKSTDSFNTTVDSTSSASIQLHQSPNSQSDPNTTNQTYQASGFALSSAENRNPDVPTLNVTSVTNSEQTSANSSDSGQIISPSAEEEARELVNMLYGESLPSIDDSGVGTDDRSSTWSTESIAGSECYSETWSVGEPSTEDLDTNQPELPSSDRGTPDGSVEGNKDFELGPDDQLVSDETVVPEGSESEAVQDTLKCIVSGSQGEGKGGNSSSDSFREPAISDGDRNNSCGADDTNGENVSKSSQSESTNMVVRDISEDMLEDISSVVTPASEGMSGRDGRRQTLLEKQTITATATGSICDINQQKNNDGNDMQRNTDSEGTGLEETPSRHMATSREANDVHGTQDNSTTGSTPHVTTPISDSVATVMSQVESNVSQREQQARSMEVSVPRGRESPDVLSSSAVTETLETSHSQPTTTEQHQSQNLSHSDPTEMNVTLSSTGTSPPAEAQRAHPEEVVSPNQHSQETGKSLARFLSRLVVHVLFKPDDPFYV